MTFVSLMKHERAMAYAFLYYYFRFLRLLLHLPKFYDELEHWMIARSMDHKATPETYSSVRYNMEDISFKTMDHDSITRPRQKS